MQDEDFAELADALTHTARSAGELILRFRNADSQVSYKADGSPVTDADRAAEELILNDLARLAPGYAVVAEESASVVGDAFDVAKPFFLVDPVDGTRDFVRGGDDFTVNIGLIVDFKPVFGLIYAPARKRLYVTRSRDSAVWAHLAPERGGGGEAPSLSPLHSREPDPARLTALASRSHINEKTSRFIARLSVTETLQFSSSLKFCVLAEGKADLYPRLSPTSEWDTAAGHAILNAAGGAVIAEEGVPLTYGKRDRKFLNAGFVAWGRHASDLDI